MIAAVRDGGAAGVLVLVSIYLFMHLFATPRERAKFFADKAAWMCVLLWLAGHAAYLIRESVLCFRNRSRGVDDWILRYLAWVALRLPEHLSIQRERLLSIFLEAA